MMQHPLAHLTKVQYYTNTGILFFHVVPRTLQALNFTGIGNFDGDIVYCVNGLLHREDGPAWLLQDGTLYWYIRGVRQRLDGPAIIMPTGGTSWFYNNIRLPPEVFSNPDALIEYYKKNRTDRKPLAGLIEIVCGKHAVEALKALALTET